jgi:hypothetical protein
VPECVRRGRGAVRDTELHEDVLDVRADRARADHEVVRDLGGAPAARHELQHFELARRELRDSVLRRASGILPASIAAHPERPAYARNEFVGIQRLDEIVVCAEQQAGNAVVRLCAFTRNEDDGELVAEQVAELAVELEAAALRQPDVQECEV